jgi:hypothetical protein
MKRKNRNLRKVEEERILNEEEEFSPEFLRDLDKSIEDVFAGRTSEFGDIEKMIADVDRICKERGIEYE